MKTEHNKKALQDQWIKLGILCITHLFIDMFAGFLPAILPPLRERFDLSLTMGVVIITFLGLVTNGVQILFGHTRAKKTKPFFIIIGFILASIVCLITFLPINNFGVFLIFLLLLVGGAGIAVYHPESLRAVHDLNLIPATIRTPIYFMGGFLGFNGGAWIGAFLVETFNFNGLLLLIPFAAVGLFLCIGKNITLKIEADTDQIVDRTKKSLSVWPIFFMAFQATTCTVIMVGLLPTHLNLLGFSLTFGGLSVFLFGASSGIGGIIWGIYAKKQGELRTALRSMMLSVPFFILYIIFSSHKVSVLLLAVCGFSIGGSFPSLVSLARHASGMNLGARMALMVGGVWGVSSLILLLITPIAEYLEKHHNNLALVLHIAWITVLTSIITGFIIKAVHPKPQVTIA